MPLLTHPVPRAGPWDAPGRVLVVQVLTQTSGSKANTAKATVNNRQMIKDFSRC